MSKVLDNQTNHPYIDPMSKTEYMVVAVPAVGEVTEVACANIASAVLMARLLVSDNGGTADVVRGTEVVRRYGLVEGVPRRVE